MVIHALALAFSQLGDRRLLAVLGKSLALSLLLCLVLGVGLAEAGRWAILRYVPDLATDWMHAILLVGGVGIAMFAFRTVAVPVTGLFGDDVVAAVEQAHYPAVAALAVRAPFALSLRLGLASAVRVLLLNLAALPAYVVLLFTAIGPLLLFLALNAVLLGRDLAEMVAVRHLDASQRQQWLRNSRLDHVLLGLTVTGLFLIPFVNLIAPIVGAAAATHMFHGRRTTEFLR